MAYFRCVGGVGGGAVLTLTYSSEFYGETITATDGTKTVTKVAPSTGTMDITLPESGTWVVSATIDGQTYSTTVTVDLEYTATLEAIPDGSTVTPTDDIQTWLKCAGITDKTTYTTLSDVLGDTETFIALCADSNACDYMARSTTWASGVAADSTAMLIVGKYNYCANALLGNSTWASAIGESAYMEYVLDAKVPTMTSNTTPSGVVSASSASSSAYKVFNNDWSTSDTTRNWYTSTGTNQWIAYDFTTPIKISKVDFIPIYYSYGGNDYYSVQSYKIRYSDDGTTWEDIPQTYTRQNRGKNSIDIDVATSHRYWSFYIISTSDTSAMYAGLVTLQFYGRTDNANYIPLVPTMTSDTTPSGQVIYSSAFSGQEWWRAFGSDASSVSSTATPEVGYAGYKFTSAKVVNRVDIRLYLGNTIAFTFNVQGSDTGNDDDWHNVATNLAAPAATVDNELHTYTFENSTAYLYWRIKYNSASASSGYSQARKLQFYRKATLPIIHSAVEDNIFYMDDGSPVALCGIPIGDTIDVDLEAYKGQTLTLVSTVAKDPTNLSNDFSMNVRITPNITEIYLMPYGALYWWGNNRGVSEYTTSAISSSASTKGTVTFNKQSVIMYNPATSRFSQIASNNTIDFTDYTALKCIGNDGNVNGMEHGVANTSHTLISGYSKMWTQDTTTRLYTLDITSCTATGYAYVANPYYSGTGTCYALWFE